jgi:uncharacterized protein YcnI
MRRSVRAAIATGAATAIAVIGFAGVAQAHVTVDPSDATQGGFARIAFRVPDESDTLSSTKIEVNLPIDEPVASVLVQPVPGWTAQVSTTKLAKPITTDDGDQVTEAVSKITWTADSAGSAIKPGQFQEFPVSLGPLPTQDSMTFKTLQTYSDGSIVRWIDESTPGGPEPEHPAPVLHLAKAAGGGGGETASAATPTVTKTAAATSSSNAVPLTISIIAAVLALAGLVLAGLAYKRNRQSA